MSNSENTLPPIHARRHAAATSGRSYLQGYADALLLQDSQDSLFSTDRSRIENVLPHNAQSFISRYPLVTVAALGAAAGATFVGTSYLTARLLRRGLKHGPTTAESRYASHVGKAAQEDAERRIVAEVQAVRRVCRDEIRDIQPAVHNSLAHGLRSMLEADLAGMIERAAGKAVKKELAPVKDQAKDYATREDLETTTRELFDQMVMATRDRRVEAQGIRSEMLGQMMVIQDLVEGLKTELEVAKARGQPNGKEAEPAAATVTRKPEAQADSLAAENQRDAQAAAAAAVFYNYDQVSDSLYTQGPQATPKDTFDENIQAALDDCSARRENDPVQYDPSEESLPPQRQPHTYYPSPAPVAMSAEDEGYKEMTRQDLYKDIQAYKDYYQSVMEASAEMPAGTEAEEMLDQLHNAQEAAAPGHGRNKNRRKATGAINEAEGGLPADDSATSSAWPSEQSPSDQQDNTSGIAPESDWAWTGLDLFPCAQSTTTSSPGSPERPAASGAGSASSSGPDKAPRTAGDPAAEPKRTKKTVPPAIANIPRLGVDDSGDWRFVLLPRPRAALRAEGWRLADLIYESSKTYHANAHGFEFRCGAGATREMMLIGSSSGSEWESYSNQQIYFYPMSKVARIDGRIWRCVQCSGLGEYRIVEDLGEVTRPEWDGVGYSKD